MNNIFYIVSTTYFTMMLSILDRMTGFLVLWNASFLKSKAVVCCFLLFCLTYTCFFGVIDRVTDYDSEDLGSSLSQGNSPGGGTGKNLS